MSIKKAKARIIITSGHRTDLRTEIDVLDVQTGKLQRLGIMAGPDKRDVENHVRQVKNQLERAGNEVSFKEMRG